jgi:hypothetical protein
LAYYSGAYWQAARNCYRIIKMINFRIVQLFFSLLSLMAVLFTWYNFKFFAMEGIYIFVVLLVLLLNILLLTTGDFRQKRLALFLINLSILTIAIFNCIFLFITFLGLAFMNYNSQEMFFVNFVGILNILLILLSAKAIYNLTIPTLEKNKK